MQLDCCQTEVEFVRRRLKQTEEKLEAERRSRQELDAKVRRAWPGVGVEWGGSSPSDCKTVCPAGGGAAGAAGAVQAGGGGAEAPLSARDL